MIRLRSSKAVEKLDLDDIFSEQDDLGLLDVAPLRTKAPTGNILANQLEEISNFYEKNGRVPRSDAQSFDEKRLARRLNAFKSNPEQYGILSEYDRYSLLEGDLAAQENVQIDKVEDKSLPTELDKSELVTSLDDIFDDDDDGLLEFDAPHLFTKTHVPAEKKSQPDEIARRQPCAEFHRFSPIFETIQQEIRSGSASLERFRHELQMRVGDAFILNGLMGYVYSAGERLEGYSSYNARLHLIFENGTEMHMLFQSLTHGLVRDERGCKIIRGGESLEPDDTPVPAGLVYVLATKSTDSALAPYKANLYKVGFTDGKVEERIKYAEKDKTFLEAPVRVVMTTECYNIDAHKLETLIHGFLGHRRLNVTLKGHAGQYSPREWFYVPLNTVLEVISYILDGTISQYRMDNTTGKVVKK
ncbi:TPA: GIY-YIG nuclease family protein [Vibrio cholerae]|uniref:GIY-YIG nuclease family protein n=1 Tax=Vibrio paracholerae TaxID=650003 RepID=UPI000DE32D82|nr:GIY-YIG nuclease family protein [Vibrio paracholerae]RBM87734.1 GIY-YIG nuclease family protein [Vibrio paracholerae]HEJ2447171.1 GIY-YIG nuclease family protein [Vibrio cholerae]